MEISVIREPYRDREESRTRDPEQRYIPPTGRGGAGSRSRSRGRNLDGSPSGRRSNSASQSRSATPGPGPATLARERGRSPAASRIPAAAAGEADEHQLDNDDARGDRIEPEAANIDFVRPPAILRGVLTLHLTKPTKIRKIGVKLVGEARTEWPEGIGARRLDTTDRTTLIEEEVIFLDARTGRPQRTASRPSTATVAPEAPPDQLPPNGVPAEPAPEYTEAPSPNSNTRTSSLHEHAQGINNRTADLRAVSGTAGVASSTSNAASRASSVLESDRSTSHRIATPDGYPHHPLEHIETNISQVSLQTSHSAHSGGPESEDRGRSGRPTTSEQPAVLENSIVTSPLCSPDLRTNGEASLAPTQPPTLPSSSRRGSSIGTSALRKPGSSARSPSTSSAKSARFSIGSFLRGKSTSRPPLMRTLSPEGIEEEHRSKTRSSGLKAIKQVLNGSNRGERHAHSDTDWDSDEEDDARGRQRNQPGWTELQEGVYEYPIHISVPQSLPPTIHTNHGVVEYWLKGFASRSGALTTRLTTASEVHVVAAPNEDDLEAIEPITVERMWETELSYKIVISVKSAPIGGEIPVSILLHPLGKMKVFRFTATLEEVGEICQSFAECAETTWIRNLLSTPRRRRSHGHQACESTSFFEYSTKTGLPYCRYFLTRQTLCSILR